MLELDDEHVTVQLQQVVEAGQQTLLVTAHPVGTIASDAQDHRNQNQD